MADEVKFIEQLIYIIKREYSKVGNIYEVNGSS
jgi:hypothetical protein